MATSLEELLKNTLNQAKEGWSQTEINLVETVVRDYFRLVLLDLQGDKVDEELAVLKAIILNLSSATQATAVSAINEMVGKLLDMVADRFRLTSLI